MKLNCIMMAMLFIVAPFSAAQPNRNMKFNFARLLKQTASLRWFMTRTSVKGCLRRLIDVHQVAVGNNGKLYMHGWQYRGCTYSNCFIKQNICE